MNFKIVFVVYSICVVLIGYRIGYLRGECITNFEREKDRISFTEKEVKHYSLLFQIVKCESEWDNDAIGDRNLPFHAHGLAQYQNGTFYELAEECGIPSPNIKSAFQQLAVLDCAIKRGYGRKWKTCYQVAKETINKEK